MSDGREEKALSEPRGGPGATVPEGPRLEASPCHPQAVRTWARELASGSLFSVTRSEFYRLPELSGGLSEKASCEGPSTGLDLQEGTDIFVTPPPLFPQSPRQVASLGDKVRPGLESSIADPLSTRCGGHRS